MLKRKANESNLTISEDPDENQISTLQEIHQRKIFRAKRPTRNMSQSSLKGFKIKSQLISLEEEVKLLSLNNNSNLVTNYCHKRTESSNPYVFDKFSTYSAYEPLKEIIQNFQVTDESQRLKDFLQSKTQKNDEIIRFSTDCDAIIFENIIKCNIKIISDKEKTERFLILKNKNNEVLINRRIERETYCKEVYSIKEPLLIISFSKNNLIDLTVKLEMDSISKHLFLRCFSESKL